MKKEVAIVLAFILIVSAGAFAQSVSDSSVGEEVKTYIKDFVNKDIESSQINDIQKVDTSNLPDQIEIDNIEENNVGIYEVNYTDNNVSKKVFVVTYSTDNLDSVKAETKNIQYLNFGISGNNSASTYLESATGVKTSESVGYVMMRSGSISGISTSLQIYDGSGSVEIKVYVNGKESGLENSISVADSKKKDYDIQAEGIINYEAGDVISVYVYQNGELNWGDAVTLVETTS